MAKTELRAKVHTETFEPMVEIWHEGKYIGAIYGADGPGVRIMTRRIVEVQESDFGNVHTLCEIRLTDPVTGE